ncbi:MAG: helix-turn-helix domain-containing protein [Ruminococcaceae bacterium]|nr:helix-turn-helix domain-containing protein [Oscillospiraceae bacterium]
MDDRICYAESGKRIKERRESLGLTLEEVGKSLGVNKSTIKRYEDGVTRRITIATYEKLAKILNTSILYLMEGEEEDSSSLNTLLKPAKKNHPIPILGVIRAGKPIIADEEILGYTYVSNNDYENYFALKVKGDSMDLVNIKEGSVVVVSKQDYVDNGDIAVVLIDNEDATVKRVFINGDIANLIPQSSNPNNMPIIVNLKEQDFRILGKVVKVEYYF